MGDGTDDDEPISGAPVPAPDRLWRHPAERGAEQAAANLAARRAGGRRWPGLVMSFLGGALAVGLAWLFSDTPEPTIEVVTINEVTPATAPAEIDGPISFDEWAVEISETNLSSVVGLHLGGEAPHGMAQAILFRDDGHLLASAQSLSGATDITAVLHDGTASPAQVVASDAVSGVAVLKIASPELMPPTFSNGRVAPRDRLVGIAGHSSDDGPLVRAVDVIADDQIAVLAGGDLLSGLYRLSNVLDASWAGAPIVDENGGIVAMAVTTADGTNHAIPTPLARNIGADLLRDGTTEHVSWLGVHLAAGLTDELRSQLDLRGGVLLTRVWNQTPAAQAGLSAGDVIIGFGTVNVLEKNDLLTALRSTSPGDEVEVRFVRRIAPEGPNGNGSAIFESELLTTRVTLGAQPRR